MFESTPLYPDASRYWAVVERHKVTQFFTAPTAIRALMRFGDAPVKKHDLSSLRVLGSVGEPINPEAWRWYHDVVGGGRCSVVDTFWQASERARARSSEHARPRKLTARRTRPADRDGRPRHHAAARLHASQGRLGDPAL
jgi:acyl-coenzyme A synthetase/AMP-(fatty) acid ligase